MFQRKSAIILVIFLLLGGLGAALVWREYSRDTVSDTVSNPESVAENVLRNVADVVRNGNQERLEEAGQESLESGARNVLRKVPFLSQAPFGEWENEVFQNACEEASMIMAMAWVHGSGVTLESGKRDIEHITRFETEMFGKSLFDTSAEDTARVMREYYHYENVEVIHDTSLDRLKNIIGGGTLIIAPVNGQALHNPHFTQPGPLEHMLVIIGYDAKKQEFITNDPGTKHGEGYRYDEKVLYEAIRDYPTGNHEPIIGMEKTIIVVKK